MERERVCVCVCWVGGWEGGSVRACVCVCLFSYYICAVSQTWGEERCVGEESGQIEFVVFVGRGGVGGGGGES